MIKIGYDLRSNTFNMDADGLGPRSLAVAAAGIVNGMVGKARVMYGEDAAEAILQMIRNMDDASAFFVAVKGDGENVSDGH